MTAPGESGGSLEALYPFLYADTSDLTSVLAEVGRSTAEKAAEIVALRESLVGPYSQPLVACAHRLAESFASRGKLFAFGNGGSSSDAQEVAYLFLHPPGGRDHCPPRHSPTMWP